MNLETTVLAASDCTGDIQEVESDRRVITDTESFRAAFAGAHQSEITVPTVEFERHAVIAVFRGPRPQCGSTISVQSVRDEGESIKITVLSRDACGGDDAVSYPFAFVRIPRVAKPHTFVEVSEVMPCE